MCVESLCSMAREVAHEAPDLFIRSLRSTPEWRRPAVDWCCSDGALAARTGEVLDPGGAGGADDAASADAGTAAGVCATEDVRAVSGARHPGADDGLRSCVSARAVLAGVS